MRGSIPHGYREEALFVRRQGATRCRHRRHDVTDHAEFIANVVANAIRRGLEAEALDTTQGVTISVQPSGAKLHVEAKATTG